MSHPQSTAAAAVALVSILATSSWLPAQVEEPPAPASNQFVRGYIAKARDLLAEGKAAEALVSVRRALERDHRNLDALRLSAEIAEKLNNLDAAVHAWHRWMEGIANAEQPVLPAKVLEPLQKHLLELDPEAHSWGVIQSSFQKTLLALAREYKKSKDWLGAIMVFKRLLVVDPDNNAARIGIRDVRRAGGREVAVVDVYAGTDPTGGLSEEAMAKRDAKHLDWKNAYKKRSTNYRYRTNAGFLTLQTASIAMEQMNRFYRKFFHYKESGGKTPMIEIRIFKNREEYLKLGQSPAEWSGGQFTMDAVETYVGGSTGKASVRETYRTLFHEAAHQFVFLAGRGVPGWLNEAYASFFEGCVILSNGTVQWNMAPPGRLLPLARRLEHGFMGHPDEAQVNGPRPDGAPSFRMVIENNYQWGPAWYAPTWGVVYFLYNYRSQDGRPVYRKSLHKYFVSFKRKRPKDAIAHFEEIVLRGAALSPVKTIDALTPIWKEWILRLRDIEIGKTKEDPDKLLQFALAAMKRKDKVAALEFLEEARENDQNNPELLWRLADILEKLKRRSRAAAAYREFIQRMEILEKTADPRYATARDKLFKLDSLARQFQGLEESASEKGLQLAKSYEARKLPMMAMVMARRVSMYFNSQGAMDYYRKLAMQSGASLAHWRVAYNEADLSGWSGATDNYQAYGSMIRAQIGESEGDAVVTAELTCDVTFDGDYSLEAKMRIEKTGDDFKGRLMGLCFGRKTGLSFHAVLLHPSGYLDISSMQDGQWLPREHRELKVGADWHTLRIDVTRSNLDVYLDGLYVRSMDFGSPSVVRGGFGLLTGGGAADFKDIRILARAPGDHAARIEREIAMQKVMQLADRRKAGFFTGFPPPTLAVNPVRGKPPVDLKACLGKPVMLLFWSPHQDKIIPCTAYYQHLIEMGKDSDLATIVVCPSSARRAEVHGYLAKNPLPDAQICFDKGGTYASYFIKVGAFGMPRVMLLDRKGIVVFEGEPGMRSGEEWKPDDQPTFIDAAFKNVLKQAK